ncbi:MAG TPA: AAA family ATPase [Polyangiales bacterium]|nr:AAA family ATPase [Polyangiales bacterium]
MSEVSTQSSLERYQILELLGHGGMGSVHRVIDRVDGRCLALKRLDTRHKRSAAGLTEMFHQEFRTLAQLRHPHVVEVYDFGIDDSGPYYTMEWLDGGDLQGIAPLNWREVCELGRDVCSALALLHSRRLLHRDPSPRNLKRLHSGCTKLLDFGGMMAMGIARNTVGTAPLVAPEVVLQQTLDGRTDLYALGGSLYFALTGKHVYPARSIAELPPLWRVPPIAPSAYVAGIPAELDHLVLSLLNLEPGSRPRSAAEVLERLSAIGDLPGGEMVSVSSAYLSTPELVGRQNELSLLRTRLRELHAGQGGVIWISGEPGVGRSRMLAAAALEAKLAGASVASARADGSAQPYGVLRQLLSRLSPMAGTCTCSGTCACPPSTESLRWLMQGSGDPEYDRDKRAQLQAAFVQLVRERAERIPVVLLVDDIERADEPSQAALAQLAHAAERLRVMIGVANVHAPEPGPKPALTLLAELACELDLRPLRGEETRALLASMFGDVPNLGALAVRIHELCEGSPRGAVDLAQFLVDERLATYHMGAWLLPEATDASRLPVSLNRARSHRLRSLSPDARELAEALAVAEGSGLPACAFVELTEHADPERARAALDQLLSSQILQRDGLHYAFEAQVWLSKLREGMSAADRRRICRRIAAALARHGRDRLEVARYGWLAGDARLLVETLLSELEHGSRWDRCPRDYAAMLTSAVDACAGLRRSQRDWFMLLRELVKVGQDLTVPRMREHLTALFGQLELDSGLCDASDPELAGMKPDERMQRVLELAQRRYDATPEHARCLTPIEAITCLTWLTTEAAALAGQTCDARLFDLLPSLELFMPLSFAIEHIQREVIPATRDLVAGRFEAAIASNRRSLEFLQRGDAALMDDTTRAWGKQMLHYALGCTDAAVGRAQALVHATELERIPAWRVPAATIRHIYYGAFGNARESERCRKHIELTLLQGVGKPPLVAGAAFQHVYTASLCEDVTALRHCIAEMRALAGRHPTLAPFHEFARAEHARVCGDTAQALESYVGLGQQVIAGDYPLWGRLIGSHLTALASLTRYDEALELGRRALSDADRVGLGNMKHFVEVPLALVEARLCMDELARTRIDGVIRSREEGGFEGASLGWAYEARARLALLQNDEASFEKYAMLCRQQYKKTDGNPALAAKYEQLMQEARQAGARVAGELAEELARSTTTTSLHTSIERGRDLLRELRVCRSANERAQAALSLLLERAKARHGALYLLSAQGLAQAAATGSQPDENSYALARRLVDPACDEEHELSRACTAHSWRSENAERPLLLTYRQEGVTWLVGVAVLRDGEERGEAGFEVASVLAKVLVECRDAVARAMGTRR